MATKYVIAPEIPETLEEEFDTSMAKKYANEGRKSRIARYRKHAGIADDELITEENLNEYAFARTINECGVGSDRLKAELLGQKWSEYED